MSWGKIAQLRKTSLERGRCATGAHTKDKIAQLVDKGLVIHNSEGAGVSLVKMQSSERGLCSEHEECVRLMFVGSPLLDVTAECGPDLLRKYSLQPDDCVRATGRHDGLFRELFDGPGSRMDAGGSALNSAKIAKWTLGRKGHIAFAGCVGDDEYATRLESELRSDGVEPLFVTLSDQPTGVCACLLSPGGNRSMCTRHGASALFSRDHLKEQGRIGQWLRSSHCVFVVGYFAAHSPEVVRALTETLLPDQLFALSLSAEYICRDFKEALLSVMPRVDILFGNGAEIGAFAIAVGLKDEKSPEIELATCTIAAARRRPSDPPRIVVLTRGPDPVLFVRGGEQPRYFPVPPAVPVLDSVGCGDALAGAFLGVYASTGNADRAVQAGIQAAVEIAQVPGCYPPAKIFTY